MIKAIETTYKGYRFRSRLEARWAVFFDSMGWEWKYEHEGYEIGWHNSDRIAWLPDFEVTLPARGPFKGYQFYVEVKGDPDFFADGEWLDRLDFNGGPPGFSDSEPGKDIIILGQIPTEEWGVLFVPVVWHRKGVIVTWKAVSNGPLFDKEASVLFSSFFDFHQEAVVSGGEGLADFQPRIAATPRASPLIMDALRTARAARFEHGERP